MIDTEREQLEFRLWEKGIDKRLIDRTKVEILETVIWWVGSQQEWMERARKLEAELNEINLVRADMVVVDHDGIPQFVDQKKLIQELTQERDELERECNWLNGEVAKYVTEADELKLQRDVLNDENNELNLKIQELEADLESWHDGV